MQVSWLVTRTLLEPRFQEPVVVMALVVSALLAALCLYARKLYEFTEFGRADTKLELMSNIMLRSVQYSTVQHSTVQYSTVHQAGAHVQHYAQRLANQLQPGLQALRLQHEHPAGHHR